MLIVYLCAFIAVTALVGGVAMTMRGGADDKVEDRLSVLTSAKSSRQVGDILSTKSVLSQPLEQKDSILVKFGEVFNLELLFDQADTSLSVGKFFAICGVLAAGGTLIPLTAGLNPALAPLMGAGMAFVPLMWLVMRKKKRLTAFGKQLPDALELMARALRSGHSLQSGFSLVADEMMAPIGPEFRRVFEEQNLGISMDDALQNMLRRVQNLDLRFFATAIVLQRQTGGDLAEILNKIGHLIRERFKIFGQVAALTGEGRLSGIVLLALPPALFAAVYYLNPDYVMPLFNDPMGRKMLAGGALMQFFGALVIRKIVNIRV
jgi:tight adherence protein B